MGARIDPDHLGGQAIVEMMAMQIPPGVDEISRVGDAPRCARGMDERRGGVPESNAAQS